MKINTTLLNAKIQDMESMVQDARRHEHLTKLGHTPEVVESKVRKFLELEKGESLVENAEKKAKEVNILSRNLLNLNVLNNSLLMLGVLTDEEIVVLNNIESKLSKIVMSKFEIEKEDLYE